MTNVDLCEEQREKCDDLNIKAVEYLADICLEIDAHLIHLSTDFIFDGKSGPYKEDDQPNHFHIMGFLN